MPYRPRQTTLQMSASPSVGAMGRSSWTPGPTRYGVRVAAVRLPGLCEGCTATGCMKGCCYSPWPAPMPPESAVPFSQDGRQQSIAVLFGCTTRHAISTHRKPARYTEANYRKYGNAMSIRRKSWKHGKNGSNALVYSRPYCPFPVSLVLNAFPTQRRRARRGPQRKAKIGRDSRIPWMGRIKATPPYAVIPSLRGI
jgi:hypothetical protein